MTNKTTATSNTVIGCIALLPLLTTILFYIDITEVETTIRIVLTIGIALCSYYGILRLAQPLAEEVKDKGKLI